MIKTTSPERWLKVEKAHLNFRRTLPFALMGVLIAASIIGGVTMLQQQGFWSTTSMQGLQGNLTAQITDPPTLPPGVSDVYISYSDIKVHMADAGNQSGWYTVAKSGQVNLTSVLNVRMTLGSASVPNGDFNVAQFDIASAKLTYNGVNYTAYIPANKIMISIGDEGVLVQSGSYTGFVIDFSPTVIAYSNQTGFFFVLIPATTSVPIPHMNWHENDDTQGTRDNIAGDTWLHQGEDSLTGNLTIISSALNSTYFSVSLKNSGTNNITLNAVSILSRSIGSTTTGEGTSNTLSTQTTSTTTEIQQPTTEHMVTNNESEIMTITSFQVLSNGTLLQPYGELDIGDHMGLVIQPGQSTTMTYTGSIVTIHDDLSVYTIVPGQAYQIVALGEFDASAYANVTATA